MRLIFSFFVKSIHLVVPREWLVSSLLTWYLLNVIWIPWFDLWIWNWYHRRQWVDTIYLVSRGEGEEDKFIIYDFEGGSRILVSIVYTYPPGVPYIRKIFKCYFAILSTYYIGHRLQLFGEIHLSVISAMK